MIVYFEKVFNGLHEFLDASKTGSFQCRSAQDAEPDFDLIEPRGMGGGKVEVDIGMSLDPRVVGFEFMNAQIIEDHMDFLARITCGDRVQEVQKFLAPLSRKALRIDLSSGHIQSRKKIGGSVPLVFMGKTGHRAPIWHFEPSLLSFKSLNTELFIHGKHNSVGWHAKIESNNVSALGVEFRIG